MAITLGNGLHNARIILSYIQGGPENCTPYCFFTNCATMCANKGCFVRFECDTRSVTLAYNILDYY